MTVLRKAVVGMIRAYKAWISPWLPRACRFEPTCSIYAAEAIELHGLARGGGLALRRLARCHPLCRGGFDPVPTPREAEPTDASGAIAR